MENQLQNLLQHSLLQSDLIAMIVISLFVTAQVIVLVQVGKRFFPVLRQIDEARRIMQEPKIVLESHAADLSLEHLRSPLDLLARLLLTRKDLELDGEACRYQIQKQEAAIAGSDDELSESRQISRAQEDDAIASAFAEQGAKICFNDINQELVDKGMAAYAEKGIKAHGYVCDVTDEPAVQAMVATIEKEVGSVDILVNNAGIIRRIPMHEMEAADFRRVIDIDLNAPFIVSKAVLPAMMKKGHGKIINICSMMSELGRETVSAYAAAKGGLKMLTRNICSEYGGYNIQCNGIGPGYIATPQTAPLREKQADGSRHPFDSFICAKTPAGRWLDPEELTGPAVFLASEASNAVNGHVLYVDGGILAYIGKQPK